MITINEYDDCIVRKKIVFGEVIEIQIIYKKKKKEKEMNFHRVEGEVANDKDRTKEKDNNRY